VPDRDKIFQPRLIYTLSQYNLTKLRADLLAGLTVGLVALPLAMAFAIASGVRPEVGLFTAIVGGFLISAFGGSRVQIGGPTGAFVVLVYGIIAQYGLEKLVICTIMAGVILVIMGLARMGSVVKYIPYPVTTGFTTGIAVLIASTQIKDFLGLRAEAAVPADFVGKLWYFTRNIDSAHWPTLILGFASVAIIIFWPKKFARRVPAYVVAMFAGTAAVMLMKLPVETIGTRFGGIPSRLPAFHVPDVDWMHLHQLLRPAITIAVLAAIESLLSAVVADGMINDRHNSNQELIGQGIANIFTPFFGGIPATGAIARTATNIRSGGRSPVAGMVHALVLLLVMVAAAPLARYIPLATLAAVLLVVAWNMGEWEELYELRRLPRSDAAVLVTVFAFTLLVDLTVAVEIGMLLATVLFIKRISDNTGLSLVDETTETEGEQHSIRGKEVPQGVLVYRVFGAFLFGATEKLEEFMRSLDRRPRVVVLRFRKIIAMDATGAYAMERLHDHLKRHRKWLVLCSVQPQPLRVMERCGLLDKLGRENVCPDVDSALTRARDILSGAPTERIRAAGAHG
jgi:sulfate permease, SulP family